MAAIAKKKQNGGDNWDNRDSNSLQMLRVSLGSQAHAKIVIELEQLT